MTSTTIRSTAERCLRQFLDSTGRTDKEFRDDTSLINGLGLSSDEGVDFVLDICEALRVELPADFNPFVHESGERSLNVSEMLDRIELVAKQAGAAA